MPPGLVPLRNLLGERAALRDKSEQRLECVLERGIIESARINVHLLEQLGYWFLFPENSRQLLTEAASRRLIDLVGTSLLAQHHNRPKELASALGRGDPWALQRIVDRHRDRSGTDVPWPTWPAFAELLLNSARQYPETAFPAVSALVVEDATRHGDHIYSETRAALFFGHDRVIELARSVTSTGTDFQPHEKIGASRDTPCLLGSDHEHWLNVMTTRTRRCVPRHAGLGSSDENGIPARLLDQRVRSRGSFRKRGVDLKGQQRRSFRIKRRGQSRRSGRGCRC